MTPESLDPDFFDAVYRRARGDDAAVPWQYARSRELIGDWFATFEPAPFRRALVVAAGLGDDAAALAAHGLDVTAFDLSPSAVDWARRRHPEAPVEWLVADLLDPPREWTAAFDLVIEVFNVQSIEPRAQTAAARNVRSFVAPGGTLVAVALVREADDEPPGPPWPIHADVYATLTAGLTTVTERRLQVDTSPACTVDCVRVEARAEPLK